MKKMLFHAVIMIIAWTVSKSTATMSI